MYIIIIWKLEFSNIQMCIYECMNYLIILIKLHCKRTKVTYWHSNTTWHYCDVVLLFLPPTNFLIFFKPTEISSFPLFYTQCLIVFLYVGERKVLCVLVCGCMCLCGCGCVCGWGVDVCVFGCFYIIKLAPLSGIDTTYYNVTSYLYLAIGSGFTVCLCIRRWTIHSLYNV